MKKRDGQMDLQQINQEFCCWLLILDIDAGGSPSGRMAGGGGYSKFRAVWG